MMSAFCVVDSRQKNATSNIRLGWAGWYCIYRETFTGNIQCGSINKSHWDTDTDDPTVTTVQVIEIHPYLQITTNDQRYGINICPHRIKFPLTFPSHCANSQYHWFSRNPVTFVPYSKSLLLRKYQSRARYVHFVLEYLRKWQLSQGIAAWSWKYYFSFWSFILTHKDPETCVLV